MADKSITIDFTQEEENGGGARPRYPEGDYVGRVKAAKYMTSKDKGTPGIELKLVIVEPAEFRGKPVTDNLWLTPKSLNRVRSFLEAVGMKVPKKKVNIPVDRLIGKDIGFSLEDDEYTNERTNKTRISSRLSWEFMPADSVVTGNSDLDDIEDEDDEDVVEEPTPKAKKKNKKNKKKVQDETEDLEDLDLDDI